MSWASRDPQTSVQSTCAARSRRFIDDNANSMGACHRVWVLTRGHWLRVITEADGETVRNTYWDGDFEP